VRPDAALVNSLAYPNANTTGVSILATGLDAKRQEIPVEAVPGCRRLAALVDTNRTALNKLRSVQDCARLSKSR
jgi:hypothetical protein